MTGKIRIMAGMLAVSALTAVAMAETATTSGKMLRMQPGNSVFTILDTNGVRPMPGSELAVRDLKDGQALTTAIADKAGRAIVELTEGRFILSVGKLNLSVLDVSPDADHTECRIVMPTQDMLVGGQAEEEIPEADPVTLQNSMMTPLVIGGGLVLVGGVAYGISETTSSSSRTGRPVEGPQPPPIVQRVGVPVPPTPGY